MAGELTLKQLRYFTMLAETGHYRKAAERVGISQPSLSLQIGNLERALGFRLVERGRAGAVLTPEGREVLSKARTILADVASLEETSGRMKAGLAGTMHLGSSPTLGPYLLPSVAAHLHKGFPDLRLMIREGVPFDLLDELLSGRHDFILTQLPVPSADVLHVRLLREPLFLAVALDHPLAGKDDARDEDLRGENVLVLSSRFTLQGQIAQLAQDAGANVRQDYEGSSLDALLQMTAMNMGVTFLPALYAHSEMAAWSGDVALVPFRRGGFTRSIGLVWRKSSGDHAAFKMFADVIRAVTRKRFAGIVSIET